MIFNNWTIGLVERLTVKRKSPHFVEGYSTWCGLLCDYRTQITPGLKKNNLVNSTTLKYKIKEYEIWGRIEMLFSDN